MGSNRGPCFRVTRRMVDGISGDWDHADVRDKSLNSACVDVPLRVVLMDAAR